MSLRIDHESRIYIYTTDEKEDCLCVGFDVAERRIHQIGSWCGLVPVSYSIGTPDHYHQYAAVMRQGALHAHNTGLRCNADLTDILVGLEGYRVEVTAWPSGEQTHFNVGKSTGWLPIHLALANRRSRSGPAVHIPEGATVKIINTYLKQR